jgi:hypothetical protein
MDFQDVIAGAMPRWRRNLYKSVGGFMCLLFGGLGFAYARFLVPAAPDKARLFAGLLFVLLMVAGIGSQIWFQRRIIAEFRYDGLTLQFQTLAIQQPQIRPRADLKSIGEWRGKGGLLGYRFLFQDRQRLYLEFSVRNSIELVNRLRADLRL